MSELFGFFDGKNGQDFYADGGRFYKMEMTTAMSGQNARESALVKKRISKDYFFEFAIIPQPAQSDLDAHIEQMESIEAESQVESVATVSYIAKPIDSRCSWWSMIIPQDQQLDGNILNAPYLRAGADLELKAGDMLITSEANHHRKNRGYIVVLRVCDGEQVITIKPTAQVKARIKERGGSDLMHESGDVNGCIRIAVWLRRQSDLKYAVQTLLNQ